MKKITTKVFVMLVNNKNRKKLLYCETMMEKKITAKSSNIHNESLRFVAVKKNNVFKYFVLL